MVGWWGIVRGTTMTRLIIGALAVGPLGRGTKAGRNTRDLYTMVPTLAGRLFFALSCAFVREWP